MSNSILFKKFLPSILSQRTSLKLPPKFSHLRSFTNWPGKKSLRGDWAIATWTPECGSQRTEIILEVITLNFSEVIQVEILKLFEQ